MSELLRAAWRTVLRLAEIGRLAVTMHRGAGIFWATSGRPDFNPRPHLIGDPIAFCLARRTLASLGVPVAAIIEVFHDGQAQTVNLCDWIPGDPPPSDEPLPAL